MPSVKLPNGAVHYTESGEGVPVVLLHANPGDSRDYDGVISELSKSYRVLALDWPGYGKSDIPINPESISLSLFDQTLREFLSALSLPSVFLVGNSLGGNVSVRLAVESPELVRGLVLVSPGGFTRHNFATRFFCKVQGSRFSLSPRRWASTYLKQRSDTTAAMLQRAAGEQARPERIALNRAVWRAFTQPAHDLRESAKLITAPTMLLFGEHDPAIPAKRDGKIAEELMPGARVAVLPCGHVAFAEVPDKFLDQVVPFLAENA
jgi:pimeloyl-ACP methyl ester carboxylesterase